MTIDLHTHTSASPDASIEFEDLKKAYQQGKFNIIALTDHHTTSEARRIKSRHAFPVIVGQEITTQEGDLIGLFLRESIPERQTLERSLALIKEQGGLAMVPHPFDPARTGISKAKILAHADQLDLIEIVNGRAAAVFPRFFYQNQVDKFKARAPLLPAAGSDAHEPYQIGRAYLRANPQKQGNRVCDLAWRAADNPQVFLSLIKDAKIELRNPGSVKNFLLETAFICWRELRRAGGKI